MLLYLLAFCLLGVAGLSAGAQVEVATLDRSWIVGLEGIWEETDINAALSLILSKHNGKLHFTWKSDKLTICQIDFVTPLDFDMLLAKVKGRVAEAFLWTHHNHNISRHEGVFDWLLGRNCRPSALSWGLDRIDQPYPVSYGDNTYGYLYDGAGVHVYIVDTGVFPSHEGFEGRAQAVFSSFGPNDPPEDCNGHGTHVSGIVGSKDFGVAKKVNLYGLKAIDCFGRGSVATVLRALRWAFLNHKSPAIINLSLGTRPNRALEEAVRLLTEKGITVVAAAGNTNEDACNVSPSRISQCSDMITVGASNALDEKAPFSTYGHCVTLFAPGVAITSTYISNPSSRTVKTGTSQASPFVTGIAALWLQYNSSLKPHEVKQKIIETAQKNRLDGLGGSDSPNLLAFVPPELSGWSSDHWRKSEAGNQIRSLAGLMAANLLLFFFTRG